MLLLAFAITLFIAVLISCKARQSVLSVSVLFLAAGLILGKGVFGTAIPNRDLLYELSELALFSVLFTDGMNTGGLKNVQNHWRLPGRALLIGMPLTILGIGALSHWVMGLPWNVSFLIGAVLSPTDPIFVSAIFQFEAVPDRIKHVLNLESGLNDGLALPAVLILLNTVTPQAEGFWTILWEMVLGIAIGVGIPWIGVKLEQWRVFGAAGLFQRLNAFALGLLVLGVSKALNANLFLAAFCAGITIVSISRPVKEAFQGFGEVVTELLKLGALLIFGARVAPVLFSPMPWTDYVFAALALFVVRIVAIEASFLGTGVPHQEVLTIGWFGPKGFSSVVYSLMILRAATPVTEHAARVCALAIAGSILIYSSTDILVGRRFERRATGSKGSLAARELDDQSFAA